MSWEETPVKLPPVVDASYDFVEQLKERADGAVCGAPWWYGWALREAFVAGAKWINNQTRGPLMEVTGKSLSETIIEERR